MVSYSIRQKILRFQVRELLFPLFLLLCLKKIFTVKESKGDLENRHDPHLVGLEIQ